MLRIWIKWYLIFTGVALHATGIWLLSGEIERIERKTPLEIVEWGHAKVHDQFPQLAHLTAPLISMVRALQPETVHISLPPLKAWLFHGANAAHEFTFPTYDQSGRPNAAVAGQFLVPDDMRVIRVDSNKQLLKAISRARGGTIVEIQPGTYQLKGHAFPTKGQGLPSQPIIVRARNFGEVVLELSTLEGFLVSHPYWVFENLDIRGTCRNHSRCEHAFHVVGKAHSTVIRNCRIQEFNAPLKVNSLNAVRQTPHPDYGLVSFTTVANSAARRTASPVTLLNINNGNGWVVRRSVIADFAKAGSDRTSYGAFMKGNSRNGLFEQNLVICENRVSAKGTRVGLSFGGGGTATISCRGGSCKTEHREGIMRNNIIMNCSDVGIYLNRSADTQVHNNLLVNTLGIDARFETTSVSLYNNVADAHPAERDGGLLFDDNNAWSASCLFDAECALTKQYANLHAGDLNLKNGAHTGYSLLGSKEPTNDFCGQRRPAKHMRGPVEYPAAAGCLPGN